MAPAALDALAWSAPRLDGSDFAPEDPLAVDHLHQQLGNALWPGFTTRTGRAFYYVVVTYGLWLVDELLQEHGIPATEAHRRAGFERWERLWALAVCESWGGNIPGDDAMRGRNGVVRAWRGMGDRRPLDYPLISRQLELGALGAYRSSLVDHGLVAPDVLRPTARGVDLARAMWAGADRPADLEAYARACLEPGRTEAWPQVGRTTLRSFGERCRLSSIRARPALQAQLGALLFEDHPPPASLRVLPEMARLLAAAHRDGPPTPRGFLAGLLAGTWGAPSADVERNARVALVFGDVASALRAGFDRAYRAVLDGGYQAPVAEVARAAVGDAEEAAHLGAVLDAWRADPDVTPRVRAEVHGGGFAATVAAVDPARPVDLLVRLLALHRQVQVARGRSGAWLALDGDRVLMEAGNYRSWSLHGRDWVVAFKLPSMRELLRDLGRVGA